MTKLAFINISFGFAVIVVAAFGGVFNAWDLTDLYLKSSTISVSWQSKLSQAAHGHFNLFGMIHILFGLTLSYSRFSQKFKQAQTLGLAGGTIAMGPLLYLRGILGPEASTSPLGLTIGALMTLAMISLMSHAFAMAQRIR